ncbi:putative RNA polymerase II subunit B1 CTD phosphatase RPAP2 [Orchesella cincta]|uniref:RNA polymerase II subunit B1 CTD phosphatase RPAP2 homolog n=1 Tax=Orchesella cincta TaxID=48709 RepID=A0A1D2MQP8_ORCCI|nr:putative RNA polymerase II subunit B1 CTD phosphatase RPAP2 [Orchesella cincta]
MTSLSNQSENVGSIAGGTTTTGPSTSVQSNQAKKSVTFAGRSGISAANNRGTGRAAGTSKKPPQQRKVNAPNIKKENIGLLIKKKKECEKRAHDIVLRLIEPEVSKEYLLENALKISKQHMEDVVEERKISQICGWVLCDNPIDLRNAPKQTYSIRGRNVYDITERKSFCSGKCYAKSSHFTSQLLTSPLWIRDMEDDVEFEILEDSETKELHGLTVTFSNVNLSDESDEDDEDTKKDSSANTDSVQ